MSARIHPLTGKASAAVGLATARVNVWEGSVRSGKTVSSLLAWLLFSRSGPPGNLIMIGKTERTLIRNVINPLIEWLGSNRCRLVTGTGELWICGRRVYICGANDERAQEKIRGLTLVGAYVDEASLLPESMWTMLLSRLSEPGARVYATTNPDNPSHWLKRDYLNRARFWLAGDGTTTVREVDQDTDPDEGADVLDLARFSFRLDDNPNLDPTYVDSLKREYVGLWYRRFILGDWVVAEGAVYDMWDPERHVVSELPPIERWLGLGIDYGTSNPFAGLLLGVGRKPGEEIPRLYLTDEWRYDSRRHRRQLTDPEYSARVRAWLARIEHRGRRGVRPPWTFIDPSAASMHLQLYRDGVSTAHAINDVDLGIRLTAGLLGTDSLLVHESCEGFIEEVSGYCWDDKKAEKGEDAPIKVADHSLDAARYVIASTAQSWGPLLRSTLHLAA